jgi:hypothetical protein
MKKKQSSGPVENLPKMKTVQGKWGEGGMKISNGTRFLFG